MKKYLGVDYGKKIIGLAISEGELASPYKLVEVGGLEDAVKKVLDHAKYEGVDVVVVGMPESGEAHQMTKRFTAEVRKHLPVVEVDETLTSKKARQLLVQLGKNSRGREDATAAAIILQGYLDSR